jgi:DNA-binding IclR family transcriptional regulator
LEPTRGNVGMAKKDKGVRDHATVQSVERSLDILEALAAAGDEVGVLDLSKRVSLRASTVHRLLATLVLRGYARQNSQTGRYSLGPRALQLSHAFHNGSDLRAEAHHFLQRLMEESGETANLTILDHAEAVYIDQVPSPHTVRMFAEIGRRVPLHSTGCGKVFLAYLAPAERARLVSEKGLPGDTRHTITTAKELERELAEIRRRGYAVDNQEHDEEVRCVAAPVRDHTGEVTAALSLSGPTTRVTIERVPELGKLLTMICSQLSATLGYQETTK